MHDQKAREWYQQNNTVVVLKAKNEQKLYSLLEQYKLMPFYEPDLDGSLTAVAGLVEYGVLKLPLYG